MGRALFSLVVVALALCGCHRVDEECGSSAVCLGDARLGVDSDGMGCNPIAQTGCGVDEKCTAVRIDSANDVVKIACVPKGTVPTGGACSTGPDGETTGFDNCRTGALCAHAVCEELCTDSPDSCTAPSMCVVYDGLLPPTTGYGVCE